jgi:hypothetical protein
MKANPSKCCGHLGTGNDKGEGVVKCVVAVEQAEIYELDVPNSSESAATQPNYPRSLFRWARMWHEHYFLRVLV